MYRLILVYTWLSRPPFFLFHTDTNKIVNINKSYCFYTQQVLGLLHLFVELHMYWYSLSKTHWGLKIGLTPLPILRLSKAVSENFQPWWVPRLVTVVVYKVGDNILLKCLLVMFNKMFSDWTAVLILFVKNKRLQIYVLHLEESLWFYSETRCSAHQLTWAKGSSELFWSHFVSCPPLLSIS